jgi:hypothetical protein
VHLWWHRKESVGGLILLFSKTERCRPECGWNSVWRALR